MLNKAFKWYEELISECINGNLDYTFCEVSEGNHDCIILDINTERTYLDIESGREYIPSIVLFYIYNEEDGVLVSCKGNEYIEELYTFTSEGYGNGLYLNEKFVGMELDLFKKIVYLVKAKIRNDKKIEREGNKVMINNVYMQNELDKYMRDKKTEIVYHNLEHVITNIEEYSKKEIGEQLKEITTFMLSNKEGQ